MNVFGLLTLLGHSLRQESRSRASHWFRMGSLFVAFWLLISAHYSSWAFGSVGRLFVELLTYVDLLMILIAGSSYFGSVITEEKEQGTLGLLKLAGFSNAGLMIGKSTTRILSALIIFAMQLPLAFLAIVLGGISAPRIFAAYLALAAYLILLGNVGLLMSVVCRRNATATSTTFAIGALLVWGGKLAAFARTAGFAKKVGWVGWATDKFTEFESWFSIHERLAEIITVRSAPIVTAQFWWSQGIALGLFGLAWLLFDRFTEYTESTEPHRTGSKWARWQMAVSRPWRDAMAWKEYQFSTGGHTTFVLKIVFYAAMIAAGVVFRKWAEKQYGVKLPDLVFGSLVAVFLLEVLAFSGSVLGSEYVGGTLPNLILLPQSVARIIASKFLGGLLSVLPTLLAAGAASLFLGRDTILYDWGPRDLVLLSCYLLLLHLTMFYSIRVRRGAVAWAVGTLLIGMVIVVPVLEIVRVSLLPLGNKTPWQQTPGAEYWAPLTYVTLLFCLALQVGIGVRLNAAVSE
jgi:ABC-type transport system involved in multi-copper enzyme maturation permease subunit